MVMGYADPPYPGTARKYYGRRPEYRGEVDHRALVSLLEERHPDGWALSTSSGSLRDVLALCPPEARVCAWVKPGGVPSATAGLHNRWEPLIVVRGRQRPPGRRDWLHAHPARGGGELMGRKPLAFCAWLFECLGLERGDTLIDHFPGSGVVTWSWRQFGTAIASSRQHPVASPRWLSDVAGTEATYGAERREYFSDASPRGLSDGEAGGDGSPIWLELKE